MRLDDALQRLTEIRSRLDLIDSNRTFRSISVGISAVLVFIVAAIQATSGPLGRDPNITLVIWLSVAAISALLIVIEVVVRTFSSQSRLSSGWSLGLAQSMAPALVAGILITCVAAFEQSVFVMLPGLWSIFYGLGLAACFRLLPKACQFVSAYYLFFGAAMIPAALNHWMGFDIQMVTLFGIGQLSLTACLFLGIRNDG